MNNMPKNLSRIITIFLACLVILAFFLSGIYIGFNKKPEIEKATSLLHKEKVDSTTVDFEPFWKVWNTINEKSPDTKTTDQDKVWGAISGLANSLNDPYTVFFPPEENKLFKDTINGSFGGVGMEVGIKDHVLTVISPIKNSPSYNAGIKAGDKIIKIGDALTGELTIDKAVLLIRGDKGTKVKLTILHEGDSVTKEISIIRDVIDLPTIDTELRSDGIFVIRLYSFSSNSASLFRDALRKFIESGSPKLILDLRGNPGGYLDAAIDMASFFLPIGKTVVSEDFGDKAEKTVYRSKGYNVFNKNLKMVILVDHGSASASEILAGALKEQGVAKLVGATTYGKGSVQELVNITPDTSLKVTIAKWLTPNGISISERGLDPDVAVKITAENADKKQDPQLDKAVQLLLEPSH